MPAATPRTHSFSAGCAPLAGSMVRIRTAAPVATSSIAMTIGRTPTGPPLMAAVAASRTSASRPEALRAAISTMQLFRLGGSSEHDQPETVLDEPGLCSRYKVGEAPSEGGRKRRGEQVLAHSNVDKPEILDPRLKASLPELVDGLDVVLDAPEPVDGTFDQGPGAAVVRRRHDELAARPQPPDRILKRR